MLRISSQTQGQGRGMEPRRHNINQWNLGQDYQGLEREDGQVRIDAERSLRVRNRCLLLLFVFKRVVCTDYRQS